jgi:hypothetical protein
MCYNCSKAGYTRTECFYPRRDTSRNKIMEQEDSNNDIEEIQRTENYNLSGNRNT